MLSEVWFISKKIWKLIQSWVLWPIWLWYSCAFPGPRSQLLATELSTFLPFFESTEICLFSQNGQLLLSPCLLQEKAKQVFSFRGLLEGRISETAAKRCKMQVQIKKYKYFLFARGWPWKDPLQMAPRVYWGELCEVTPAVGNNLCEISWLTEPADLQPVEAEMWNSLYGYSWFSVWWGLKPLSRI